MNLIGTLSVVISRRNYRLIVPDLSPETASDCKLQIAPNYRFVEKNRRKLQENHEEKQKKVHDRRRSIECRNEKSSTRSFPTTTLKRSIVMVK